VHDMADQQQIRYYLEHLTFQGPQALEVRDSAVSHWVGCFAKLDLLSGCYLGPLKGKMYDERSFHGLPMR
jgi:hypothetical protein